MEPALLGLDDALVVGNHLISIGKPQWSQPCSGWMTLAIGQHLAAEHRPQWSQPCSGWMTSGVEYYVHAGQRAAMEPALLGLDDAAAAIFDPIA